MFWVECSASGTIEAVKSDGDRRAHHTLDGSMIDPDPSFTWLNFSFRLFQTPMRRKICQRMHVFA